MEYTLDTVIDNIIVPGELHKTVRNTAFPLKPLIIRTLTEENTLFIYSSWNKRISSSQKRPKTNLVSCL
jgi:hypothetical protein